jgi:hypothetical protein
MTTPQGPTVHTGWLGCVVPGCRLHRHRPPWAQSQGQQGDARAQGQQHGRGAGDGQVRPLALGLQPPMGSGFLTGDLNRPAPDDPRQDVPRGRLPVGTAARFQAQLPVGSADDDQSNLDRGHARCVPPPGVRDDPPRCALASGPVDGHGLPARIRACCPGLQAALAVPRGGFGAALALRLRPWRVLARRLPAPARAHGHLALHPGPGQGDRRQAAINDQHQRPPGPPAAGWPPQLSDPIHTGLVPSRRGLVGGPAQRGEPW